MKWLVISITVIRVLTVILAIATLITKADPVVKLISGATALIILDTMISELK